MSSYDFPGASASQDMADLVLEERKESQEALYPIQVRNNMTYMTKPITQSSSRSDPTFL